MENKFNRSKILIQNQTLFRIFLFVHFPLIILLILVILVSLSTGIPIGTFTRDPAAIAGKAGLAPSVDFSINPFLGIISSFGILLWCISATICLFTSCLTRPKTAKKKFNGSSFLKFSGLFSLFLLLDDLFLFHEKIAPKLFLSEKIVFVCYLAIVLFGITKFRKVILQTEWMILCFAFCFFGLSIILDIFPVPYIVGGLQFVLEDGFKLLGIASWCSYFVLVSLQFAKNWSCSSRNVVE